MSAHPSSLRRSAAGLIGADSIVAWSSRGQRRAGRVLGVQGGVAIVRDTEGVVHTLWCDVLAPARVSAPLLRRLGVVA